MARELVRTQIDDQSKNYIINGAMTFAQRSNTATFPAIANGAFSLDRWRYGKAGTMVHTITQDSDVPTFAESGYRFQTSLRMNLTTPDTTIATTDQCFLQQCIEGYNWAELAGKEWTISFWVKATTTGTYTFSLQNAGTDRYYIAEYTINASETWEKKTITIPASPVSGTWNYTNGQGIYCQWIIAGGTTLQGVVGSWQTGGLYVSPNQVNGTNTGSTNFRMTGVMLNLGKTAQPFTRFGTGEFDSEFTAVKRYYQRNFNAATGLTIGATTAYLHVHLGTVMRANPSLGITDVGGVNAIDEVLIAARTVTAVAPLVISLHALAIVVTTTGGMTANRFIRPNSDFWYAEAEL